MFRKDASVGEVIAALFLLTISLTFFGCDQDKRMGVASQSDSAQSQSHAANNFLKIATRGDTEKGTCVAYGGPVVPFGLIDFGPGAFRNARPADAPPYEYTLVQTVTQGLFIIRHNPTGTEYLAVSFGEKGKEGALTTEHLVSACIWPR